MASSSETLLYELGMSDNTRWFAAHYKLFGEQFGLHSFNCYHEIIDYGAAMRLFALAGSCLYVISAKENSAQSNVIALPLGSIQRIEISCRELRRDGDQLRPNLASATIHLRGITTESSGIGHPKSSSLLIQAHGLETSAKLLAFTAKLTAAMDAAQI